MKLFKSRSSVSGFTVIEAIIALLVISIMVGILLTSQGRALRTGVSIMLEQSVIQELGRRFVEIDRSNLDARKKPITFELDPPLPQGTIEYTSRRPASDSHLHRFKDLYIETLTAHWNDAGRETTTKLVRFCVRDEEEHDARK